MLANTRTNIYPYFYWHLPRGAIYCVGTAQCGTGYDPSVLQTLLHSKCKEQLSGQLETSGHFDIHKSSKHTN
jgi:hypothetical protein